MYLIVNVFRFSLRSFSIFTKAFASNPTSRFRHCILVCCGTRGLLCLCKAVSEWCIGDDWVSMVYKVPSIQRLPAAGTCVTDRVDGILIIQELTALYAVRYEYTQGRFFEPADADSWRGAILVSSLPTLTCQVRY